MEELAFFVAAVCAQGAAGPDTMTIGQLIGAVLAVDTEADARRFFGGYLAWQRTQRQAPGTTPERVVLSNIGWCFGEGMPDARVAMWRRVCDAAHPVFGTSRPTADEALRAGLELGAALRRKEDGRG